MTSYEELNEQNHHITELSNILHTLFKDRSMCDSDSCCDMFNDYMELIQDHINIVDKEMYSDLLKSTDKIINNVAKNFMSGSVEIKKILKHFNKQWCPHKNKNTLLVKNHVKFVKDTDELFNIVLQRILDETEHLYPLVRTLHKK